MLFKELAGVDAFPIRSPQGPVQDLRDGQDDRQAFGGINLEDISAPRCFRGGGAAEQ